MVPCNRIEKSIHWTQPLLISIDFAFTINAINFEMIKFIKRQRGLFFPPVSQSPFSGSCVYGRVRKITAEKTNNKA